MTVNDKTLNLKNFDVVLINYVEDTKRDELLEKLKGLYGDFEPLNTGSSLFGQPSTTYQYARHVKRLLYYDEVNRLCKPLPEKFQSMEIRIVNRITGWSEIICRGRLKQEYLEKAKQEFKERLERDNTLSTPDILEKAHQEYESYLAPYMMDNIISNHESQKRTSYPFLYIGEVGELPSNNLMDIIKDTDNTRCGIGWFAIRWASILERSHLIERTGGRRSGLTIEHDRGLSIFDIAPIKKGKDPDSWDNDTRRRFRAIGFEYQIIDDISLILLPYVVLSHRLESLKHWEKENISLSHKIQELSDKYGELNNIVSLQNEIERNRSEFLSKSFDLRHEYAELSNLIKSTSEFLLSRDSDNFPMEEPFFHPINAETRHIEVFIRSGHPKQGVLISMTEESQFKNEQFLKTINTIEQGQNKLSEYVHDIVNASLQKRMDSFAEQSLESNKKMERSTRWVVRLTWALIVLIVVQVLILIYQFTHVPKP
jgi:hypothetical protein